MDELSVDGLGMPQKLMTVSIEKRSSRTSTFTRPSTAPNLESSSSCSDLAGIGYSPDPSVLSPPKLKSVRHSPPKAVYKLDPDLSGTNIPLTQHSRPRTEGSMSKRRTPEIVSHNRPHTSVQKSVRHTFRGQRSPGKAQVRPSSTRAVGLETSHKHSSQRTQSNITSVQSGSKEDDRTMSGDSYDEVCMEYSHYINPRDLNGVGEGGLEGSGADTDQHYGSVSDGFSCSEDNLNASPAPSSLPSSHLGRSPSLEVHHNSTYHEARHTAYTNLSERDQGALRLGRLVISTVLNQPEVTVPDSVSRFFTDLWLAKNGSSVNKADSTSISLMSSLQRSITEYEPGDDPTASHTASCQKSVAAIACEALDTLIAVFGQANPVLADIRAALLPVIFFNPPSYSEELERGSDGSEIRPLTGKAYMDLPTWCEDAALIVQDLRDTENILEEERQAHIKTTADRDLYKEKYKEVECERGESQSKLIIMQRDNERLKDMTRELKSVHAQLTEKYDTLEASYNVDKKKFQKDHLLSSQLATKCKEYQDKLFDVNNQRRRLEEENSTRERDIKRIKSEMESLESKLLDSMNAADEASRSLEKTRMCFEEADLYRTVQKARNRKSIRRIHEEMADKDSPVKLSMEVRNMMRGSDPDILAILEQWNSELLMRNKELELQLVDTSVDDIIKLRLKEREDIHKEEIKGMIRTHNSAIEALRKQKDAEIKHLKESIDTIRSDLFENQIERNGIDSQLKAAKTQIKVLERKYDAMKLEWEKKTLTSTTTKLCLQDRADMLTEDTMYEVLLRETKVLAAEQNDSICSLEAAIDRLKEKNIRLEEKLSDAFTELSEKALELDEIRVVAKESQAEVVSLEQRIEELNQPSRREIFLERENSQLRNDVARLEEAFTKTNMELKAMSLSRSRQQQVLDILCMDYESYVGYLRRDYDFARSSSELQLNELCVARDDNIKLSKSLMARLEECERQVMNREEERTRAANMMLAINRSFSPMASLNENDPLIDIKSAESLDICEELEKEIAAHKKTKVYRLILHMCLNHNYIKEKYKAMLSSEVWKNTTLKTTNEEVLLKYEEASAKLCDVIADRDEARQELELSILTTRELTENVFMMKCDFESAVCYHFSEKVDKCVNTDPISHNQIFENIKQLDTVRVETESTRSTDDTADALHVAEFEGHVTTENISSKSEENKRFSAVSKDLKVPSKGVPRTRISVKQSSKIQKRMSELKRDKPKLKRGKIDDRHTASDNEKLNDSDNDSAANSPVQSPADGSSVGLASTSHTTTYSGTHHNQDRNETPIKSTLSHFELKKRKQNEKQSLSDGQVSASCITPAPPDIVTNETDDQLLRTGVEIGDLDGVQLVGGESVMDVYRASSKLHDEIFDEGELDSDLASRYSLCTCESVDLNEAGNSPSKSPAGSVSNAGGGDRSSDEAEYRARELADVFKTGNFFDTSIASKSSHNYFFEILERRERRNIFENQRLRMMLREAAGLVNRTEVRIAELSSSILESMGGLSSPVGLIMDDIRSDFLDSKWIFSVKPEHLIENQVLKDAVFIGGAMMSSASYTDDLISLDHMKSAVSDNNIIRSLEGMEHKVQELKKSSEKRARLGRPSDGKGGWRSVLYRTDGTVDANMLLSGWSRKEKNEIYSEMVAGMVQERDDKDRLLYKEISHLKTVITNNEARINEQKSFEEELMRQINELKRSTVDENVHRTLIEYISDVTAFINELTSPDSTSRSADSPSGRPNYSPGKSTAISCIGRDAQSFEFPTGSPQSPLRMKQPMSRNSSPSGIRPEEPPPRIDQIGAGKEKLFSNNATCSVRDTRGLGGGGYGDAPSSTNIYGNPGVLWRRVLQRKRAENAIARVRHCRGSKYGEVNASDHLKSFSLELNPHPSKLPHEELVHSSLSCQTQASQESMKSDASCSQDDRQRQVHTLMSDLSIACDSLAEKVLFPWGIDVNCPGKSDMARECGGILIYDGSELSLGSGLHTNKSIESQDALSLSPDILHRASKINAAINFHHEAVKVLQEQQASIFDHNLDRLSLDAERYYAASIKRTYAPDTIIKWGAAFVEGSGSKFVQNLVHHDRSSGGCAVDKNVTGIRNDQEFPVIEKRQIGVRPCTADKSDSFESRTERPRFLALPDFRQKSAPSTAQIPYFVRKASQKK